MPDSHRTSFPQFPQGMTAFSRQKSKWHKFGCARAQNMNVGPGSVRGKMGWLTNRRYWKQHKILLLYRLILCRLDAIVICF